MPKPIKAREPMLPQTQNQRPVHSIRHRRLKATIWKYETKTGPMFKVTLLRSYRDEKNAWHDTQNFGFDDLMNLSKLLIDCHTYVSAELTRHQTERQRHPRPS